MPQGRTVVLQYVADLQHPPAGEETQRGTEQGHLYRPLVVEGAVVRVAEIAVAAAVEDKPTAATKSEPSIEHGGGEQDLSGTQRRGPDARLANLAGYAFVQSQHRSSPSRGGAGRVPSRH